MEVLQAPESAELHTVIVLGSEAESRAAALELLKRVDACIARELMPQ